MSEDFSTYYLNRATNSALHEYRKPVTHLNRHDAFMRELKNRRYAADLIHGVLLDIDDREFIGRNETRSAEYMQLERIWESLTWDFSVAKEFRAYMESYSVLNAS